MEFHPRLRAFNFKSWIAEHRHLLKPPVANQHLFDAKTQMVVMVLGGPNQRVDFHDDPVEEFFYQLEGDMLLKIAEGGKIYDVPIPEGEVFFLPPHIRHSPQRPQADSIGLVVEGNRHPGMVDGFEWFCFECGKRVHRAELELEDIVKDLPPIFEAFYLDTQLRTCEFCGTVHPGKQAPPGWVTL